MDLPSQIILILRRPKESSTRFTLSLNLYDIFLSLTKEQRAKIVEQIVQYIKELQEIPLGEASKCIGAFSKNIWEYEKLGPIIHDGPSLGPFGNFNEMFIQMTKHALFMLKENDDVMKLQFVKPLKDLIISLEEQPIVSQKYVLSHLDLNPTNNLIDPTNCNVTGILDWEHSRVSPWEEEYFGFKDMVASEFGLDQEVADIFKLIELAKPNEEIRRKIPFMDNIKGLTFFCATWYRECGDFKARLKASIEEGRRCALDLAKLLKITWPS